MTQQTATQSTVHGTVEATNATGFRINGNWVNYSKYGYRGPEGNQPAPSVGQAVTVELRNDKFIHALHFGNAVATPVQPAPTPATPPAQVAVPAPQAQPTAIQALNERVNNFQTNFIQTSIDTRLAVLKTMAVAQPGMFADLDKIETLTEIVRTLETFVLEELTATAAGSDTDDVTSEDLLDDDAI